MPSGPKTSTIHFSVTHLLCAIALASVIVSTLIGANEKSVRLIGTTTFLLCVTAATFAAVGSGKKRVFAIGFLIGCLPYVTMVFGSNGHGRRFLATEVAWENLDRELKLSEPRKTPLGETIQLLNNGMVSVSTPCGFGRNRTITMAWEDAKRLGHLPYVYKQDLLPQKATFMLIGHFVSALALGVAAGTLAVFVHSSKPVGSSKLQPTPDAQASTPSL